MVVVHVKIVVWILIYLVIFYLLVESVNKRFKVSVIIVILSVILKPPMVIASSEALGLCFITFILLSS